MALKSNRIILKCLKTVNVRYLHYSKILLNFHEDNRGGKYYKKPKASPLKILKEGSKMIPQELKKMKNEIIDYINMDPFVGIDHKDFEILWKFDNPKCIEDWTVTADSDHREGNSKAFFEINNDKKGVFHGYLNTRVPKDGIIKSTGYCNITSPIKKISFQRTVSYDWSLFNHLIMKVRGDGRGYGLVVNMLREFDINWNDQFNFGLFTRGGPYWQIAKIPFSKFYLTSKGRIQDKQQSIDLKKVLNFGITIADRTDGPFKLEIDFIGLIHDASHLSQFDYEMYEISPTAIG